MNNKLQQQNLFWNKIIPIHLIQVQRSVGSHQSAVGNQSNYMMQLEEKLKQLSEGFYEAGIHSKSYIANATLPSGIYFYQLKAGNFVQTKKMMLIK